MEFDRKSWLWNIEQVVDHVVKQDGIDYNREEHLHGDVFADQKEAGAPETGKIGLDEVQQALNLKAGA